MPHTICKLLMSQNVFAIHILPYSRNKFLDPDTQNLYENCKVYNMLENESLGICELGCFNSSVWDFYISTIQPNGTKIPKTNFLLGPKSYPLNLYQTQSLTKCSLDITCMLCFTTLLNIGVNQLLSNNTR